LRMSGINESQFIERKAISSAFSLANWSIS
jgi:hypothetical protein